MREPKVPDRGAAHKPAWPSTPLASRLDQPAGARQAAFPRYIAPSAPTLQPTAPSGPEWLHEIKYDGYRVQVHVRGSTSRIFTRNGYDWTDRFSAIARTAAALPAQELVLDGEAVVLDDRGMPDMARLRSSLAGGRGERFVCFAFDLLYLDGFDLRLVPLTARKQLLAALLPGAEGALRFSEHLEGDGPTILAQACAMGLEGIVSKQRDAPYRSGRTQTWVKAKCRLRRAFPIVAFVEKLGASPRKVASLYVGRWDGDRLLYAGKVGTGYTELVARDLRERLDPYIRKQTPLSVPVAKPKATWVEPVLEAEVNFTAETGDGLLREAVFKGLR